MQPQEPPRQILPVVLFLAVFAAGCASPTTPSEPIPEPLLPALVLTGAQVSVEGQVVNGQTMQPGQMGGGSTFFQATLTGPNGPAVGDTVQVQYQRPGGGMGQGHMGGGEGFLYLYDDGTRGDPVAGDGIYCFDDQQGLFGLHMQNAPHGQYHYEFFGFDHEDHHSNHMQVVVTIASE